MSMMFNQRVYLNNAATSFPKAPGVAEAVAGYITDIGSNIHRGQYKEALAAEETVLETRELLCALFHAPKPENVVFHKNITESLNLLILGIFKPGDHVLISSMEHNAIIRPLNHFTRNNPGFSYSVLPCTADGSLSLDGKLPLQEAVDQFMLKFLRPNTKAVMITHASNVCGTIFPLKEIGAFCQRHHLLFIVDSAQTAGHLEIDMQETGIHALGFTGHKGLLGPQGIGGIVLADQIIPLFQPVIVGGSGSHSENPYQPNDMPDKYEAGTPNLPGIYGLHASLNYIRTTGLQTIRDKEMKLTSKLIDNLQNAKGLKLIGSPDLDQRTAVLSFDFIGKDNALISYKLEKDYGLINRCGLHCSPLAHQTLGTFPRGAVRLSLSCFNTLEEIDYASKAILSVCRSS
ncbi:cysteine desulfurase family protein [Syntrophobotulus glycolicus DSM 8271]|uniref:Cysteine desulfurase family protein n=1 Tax=Syntrophobotulus glycolicus (strain DSM 8271 / FlGlyR) TaxID=645991 RepID=F0T2Y3_SYNGF|nr:aminotransferase class V-fold PLP-dependent enzyme [Syntrophobotulus glycolicus]ADY57620.1 cysteine desulfurase family protein [Syntrophobotulus glycolicus DSM 8271]